MFSQKDDIFHYVKYARVSTDEQREGISVEFQLDRIDAWVAAQRGQWVCVGEFLEDASGFEYERPEMDIIWQLAKEGHIDAIVVLRRNRFSRGEAASIILEQHFKKHNVRLFSVEQGEFTPGNTNRIVSAVERAQSEEEAEGAKKNMREKRYAYIDSGVFQSQGVAKYGYRKEGKKGSTQLVVYEPEAEIVRMIMDLFIQRRTYNEIADVLNTANVPRPALAKGLNRPSNTEGWNRLGVRNLIDDARYYKGEFVAYKRATRKEDHAGKHIVINVPAIITEETYQKVAFIRSTLRRLPIYTEHDPFTLAKRMTCACGYTYSQQKTMRKTSLYRYYRCTSTDERYNRQQTRCTIRTLNADKIEAVVADFVRGIILDPRAALARYRQQQDNQQRILDNAIAHLESIDELLAELDAEREQVLTLFKKRLINEARVEADVIVIDRQREKLAVERSKWSDVLTQHSIADAKLDSLEQIAAQLREHIETADSHKLLRAFDKLKLRIHVAKEEGRVVLYISILGSEPERIEFRDDSDAACCDFFITNSLVFRIVLP
jgi:site-specific DNA recombinase